MKSILPYVIQCSLFAKRFFLVQILLLAAYSVNGQNAIVGTGFSDGWGGLSCPTGNGNFKFLGLNAGGTFGLTTTASGIGDQFFRFGVDWDGTTKQLTITSGTDVTVSPETKYNLDTNCTTNGAMKYNVPDASYNYVFKTLNAGTNPTGTFVFFEVQGAVRNVIAVSQSPLASSVTLCSATTVTATLDDALATGQEVYLRYTKDGYATSSVVKLTGSGTTYEATIPSNFNTAGAVVSYYVFTSGTTTPTGADADLYTINLNNNAGPNYSYTVLTDGITTISDAAFEQALIDLDLDCTIDGQVLTSAISGVTELDISYKSITDLTGIEAFSSLQDLYCANNSLSGSLNLSMLTNLRYIDLENNALTSLNIAGLTNLVTLVVWTNQLTTLDLSNKPSLIYLDCDDNLFTTLDVSEAPNLIDFYCSGNALTSLDLRGLTNLGFFECFSNPDLSCILVDNVEQALNFETIGNWGKDATATYSYCDCSLSTTWDGSTWSNGAPTTGTYAAIIAGSYAVPSNINACSLTITDDSAVTIPSGFNVTLNAPLRVETGSSFTLSNNANLIQTNKNSTNSGTIAVNRNSNPLYHLDYTMWSSPVSGSQTLAEFSPLTVSTRFYIYNNTLGATGLYSSIPPTTTFSTGQGYLIRMPNVGSAAYNAGTETLTYNGEFTGTPNNGDVTIPVTIGKYNAIGNPYPSTIDANLFFSGNTITEALYFWRKKNNVATSAYATYTTAGGTANDGGDPLNLAPNGTIQVGQGFIAKSNSTSLVFTNAMRSSNNSNQILKTKQIERNRIWLNLSKETVPINQMMIAYMTGATEGIDPTIDGKYFNDSQTALNSLLNNEEYVIQGRSLPFDVTDIVPLAFKTDTAGNFTIAIGQVDGLFLENQPIYLVDASNGTETDLKTSAYTFTASVGVDNARFSLKYQNTLKTNIISFDKNTVNVFNSQGTLSVSSITMPIDNIKVFDIQGRLIAEQKNVKANTATIRNLKTDNQVLIVQITGEDNSKVTKKVMN